MSLTVEIDTRRLRQLLVAAEGHFAAEHARLFGTTDTETARHRDVIVAVGAPDAASYWSGWLGNGLATHARLEHVPAYWPGRGLGVVAPLFPDERNPSMRLTPLDECDARQLAAVASGLHRLFGAMCDLARSTPRVLADATIMATSFLTGQDVRVPDARKAG